SKMLGDIKDCADKMAQLVEKEFRPI
ncbi:transcriptional regulator, partial [Sulfolobus sp. A20-N-F6]